MGLIILFKKQKHKFKYIVIIIVVFYYYFNISCNLYKIKINDVIFKLN